MNQSKKAKPQKLDWYREPKDMENKYINQSSFMTNLLLMSALVLFMICVNNHQLCPPPNFILNSDDHAMERCDIQRNQSTCGNSIATNYSNKSIKRRSIGTSRNSFDDQLQDSYRFDILMFSFALPLGLTSILMSLSSQWISTVQELNILKRIKTYLQIPNVSQNPKFYLQIDTLKAIIVFVSVLFCSAYLSPIGLSVAHWTAKCWSIPLMCTAFSLLLIPLTLLIICPLDTKDAFKHISTRKRKRLSSKNEPGNVLKEKSNSCIYLKFFLSLFITISSMLVPILLSIPLHDSKLFRNNNLSEFNECHRDVCGVAIYLIVAYLVLLIPNTVLLIHYSFLVHKIYYSGKEQNMQKYSNAEGIPLKEKLPEA